MSLGLAGLTGRGSLAEQISKFGYQLQWPRQMQQMQDTLWLFNTAMENAPFIDGLPIKNCVFLWQTTSHNQMVPSNG